MIDLLSPILNFLRSEMERNLQRIIRKFETEKTKVFKQSYTKGRSFLGNSKHIIYIDESLRSDSFEYGTAKNIIRKQNSFI